MKSFQYSAAAAAIALSLATTTPAPAQAPPDGWVQVQATSAMLGIGGASGEGQLTLPMLGSNCVYPFKASGFGVGIQVGISKISAAGPVRGMTKLEDFPGSYSATHGEATILAGGGGTELRNNANNVTIALTSQTAGLNIGVSGAGMTVQMPIPPINAPRQLVLEFGYNKDWLNKANKAQIDDFLATWKCRFANIKIVGHTDAVGKEDANLKLSINRSTAVRDYIIGSGVYAARIAPLAAGENNQQVTTYQGQRLRANRVVVITAE
ncbi:MAG TPA: OmpA family protein [Stellaceae bacterium]|jgi:outer membrane protein OmpA-like peptidoglycan-associated protein|nr:OmpA family protein [Stellaceae bacterium]